MAIAKIKITGLNYRGAPMSLTRAVEVPEFQPVTGRTLSTAVPPELLGNLGLRARLGLAVCTLPDLSVADQQRAYIDERYEELVWSYAQAREMYPVSGFSVVVPKPAKMEQIKALLARYGFREGQVAADFFAVLAAMWPEVKRLSAERIIAVVLASMRVGGMSRIAAIQQISDSWAEFKEQNWPSPAALIQ